MINYDVIVIGGGAAGLLCAGTAIRNNKSVLILDKNPRPARKVMITGKGRCNVTNNCTPEEFLKNLPTNPKFMYSAIYNFTPYDTMDLFESLGVKLKTERGNRVFPVSDKAVDIVDALQRYSKGADYVCNEVSDILTKDDAIFGVKCLDGTEYYANSIVLATGGMSYPLTGSTGDGYKFARSLGHTIIAPIPSLVPIESNDSFCSDMSGLSLKNVTLTIKEKGNKKPIFSEDGEMLFTHFGISGPLVLSASSHFNFSKDKEYTCFIDLKPALDFEKLDARILRDFQEFINKDFKNSLSKLVPSAMIPVVIKKCGIPADTKVNTITKEQRHRLVKTLKEFSISLKCFRPIKEAIITSGGISTKEINPKTMESKIIKGLFFAGEIIDVDAYTGGFNLQIAFSTGHLAGMNV
ncbi:MAG: NAD(P)/FAD-dependent oxidoreductase [Clostridia bacterium]|nr:NAD(P)/FAD-dependent oxidoreductase [Clostridia bacterium]